MNTTFDFVLAVGAVVIGLMLLTGHGSIFMKGGDSEKRKKLYDEEKMEKGSGAALLIIGILTGIDHFTTGFLAKMFYLVTVLIIIGLLVFYIMKKCKK